MTREKQSIEAYLLFYTQRTPHPKMKPAMNPLFKHEQNILLASE